MSTTHGPTEPAAGVPPGAIPHPPPPALGADPEPDDPAHSGDTDVVFRLERDVPLVHRLRELAASGVEQLLENWRMVLAGGVALAAVVALAVVVGGAYRNRPVPPPAPAASVPAAPVVPHPAEAAPVEAPLPAVAVPAEEAPPRPAVRVRARPAHPRAGSLPAQKNFKPPSQAARR